MAADFIYLRLEQEQDSKNFITDIINGSVTSWLTNYIKCHKTLYIITLCPCYVSFEWHSQKIDTKKNKVTDNVLWFQNW